MKKFVFSSLCTCILSTSILVGCGEKKLQDGTYTAEDLNYDAHGWKASVSITVSSGQISDAKFEYTAEDGTTKSKNTSYAERMVATTGITPDEYMSEYSKQLIDKQSPEKIDTISGATTSHSDFKILAEAAIEASKNGNTTTTQIELYK